MILSAASVKNSVVLFLIVVSGLSPGLLQFYNVIQDIRFEFVTGQSKPFKFKKHVLMFSSFCWQFWLPVIFGNNLEVVPRIFTLLSKKFQQRKIQSNQNQDEKDNDVTSCILANVEAISSKSVLEALVIAPTYNVHPQYVVHTSHIKLRKYSVLIRIWLYFVDLAIQVAGSWEALKNREGEMVEKRMLVNCVFHFRHLDDKIIFIYVWKTLERNLS